MFDSEADLLFADVARVRLELASSDAERVGVRPDDTFFGSGRLIGHNLILTARHVLETTAGVALPDTGWEVRLVGDQAEPGRWKGEPLEAKVIWRGKADLDIALLELLYVDRRPTLSNLRIGHYNRVGRLQGCWVAGFSYAAREKPDYARPYGFPAGLRTAIPGGPYRLAVDTADAPAIHENWRGVSGGCVLLHRGTSVWLLGVIQQVPKPFGAESLEAARLDVAWTDERFAREIEARCRLASPAPEALEKVIAGADGHVARPTASSEDIIQIWRHLKAADNAEADRQIEDLGHQLGTATTMLQAVFKVVLAREIPAYQVFEKFGEALAQLSELSAKAANTKTSEPNVIQLHQDAGYAAAQGRLHIAATRLQEARTIAQAEGSSASRLGGN